GILHLLKKMDLGGDLRCDFELPKKHSGSMVGKERQESESGPTTVRLDGIDDMVTTAELRKLFRPFGRVLEIAITESRVNNDRTLLCAAVTMEDALSAEEAAVELQQLQLRGKEMEISIVGGH
ncbi:MAG TPA: RNA-binding protein, partial [Candidatus Bathyarchaeia archaeon]|nr:RNA-binding protein [Candidatus Bathyarchaeia archaeon]